MSWLKPEQYFPAFLILLMAGSAVGYALIGGWKKAVYWAAGAVLNIVVTF